MKIGFITHGTAPQGGIESVVYHLARWTARLGHQVTVFSAREPAQGMEGIRQVRVPVPRLPFALWQLAFARASAKAVRRNPVEILQTHVNTFALAQVAVCHSVHQIGSKKVQGLYPHGWRRMWHWTKSVAPLLNWLAGVNYQRSDLKAAVATSSGIASELMSLYPKLEDKLAKIPNGIDPKQRKPAAAAVRVKLRKEKGLLEKERVLLFIGKEFHRKGLEPILRALPLLPVRVKLWVIGDNVDIVPTSYYTDLVREFGLESRVTFFGHRSDLLPFYQAADAFVFPSVYEAFAMVSIESMACGLPLLSCKINGIEDLLVDGKNGAFVTRDEKTVAAAVRRWILPEATRRRLVRGALRSAKDYTWEKIARRHIKLCKAILDKKEFPDCWQGTQG